MLHRQEDGDKKSGRDGGGEGGNGWGIVGVNGEMNESVKY